MIESELSSSSEARWYDEADGINGSWALSESLPGAVGMAWVDERFWETAGEEGAGETLGTLSLLAGR